MAVNLSPVGGVAAQFFTNTGAVLTGGKLFTYSAGTTTPAVTYTSSNGATAWTNPIVLDAAGRVPGSGEIWLTDGINYKFVLKDANDVLIATYDNISGINSNFIAYTNQQEIQTATAGQTVFTLATMQYQAGTNSLSVFVDGVNQYGPGAQYSYVETDSTTVTFNAGLHVGAEVKFTTSQQQGAGAVDASQVSYVPPFTGSVATNVEDKLAQTVSVNDFGGSASNTTTQNKAALQTAISTVNSSGGGVIIVPRDVEYGYKRNDRTTWPDFTGVVTNITIEDYSVGESYLDPTSTDGAQIRYWNHSSPYESLAQHDGNGIWVRGSINPYVFLSNDAGGGSGAQLTATVSGGVITGFTVVNGGSGYSTPPQIGIYGNTGSGLLAYTVLTSGSVSGTVILDGGSGYTPTNGTIATSATPEAPGVDVGVYHQVSYFLGYDGQAKYAVTSGGLKGGSYSDDEKDDFAIAAYGTYAGITPGDTNILVFQRSTGNMGVGVNNPLVGFDFVGKQPSSVFRLTAPSGSPAFYLKDATNPTKTWGMSLEGTGVAYQYSQVSFGATGNVQKQYSSGEFQVTGAIGAGGWDAQGSGYSGIRSDGVQGTKFFELYTPTTNPHEFYVASTTTGNAAATAYRVPANSVTSRSINAGGTVNASGADYAEYMEKAGDFTIEKGDVCGIDSNGKLTNVFANALTFVVKSTNPSYVGNDSWGTGLANDELETVRQRMDRIAFAGQVPVNVLGAKAGDYIVPVNDNGNIKGKAITSPTFEQYQKIVGKVIAIEQDGRAKIIVKVS